MSDKRGDFHAGVDELIYLKCAKYTVMELKVRESNGEQAGYSSSFSVMLLVKCNCCEETKWLYLCEWIDICGSYTGSEADNIKLKETGAK